LIAAASVGVLLLLWSLTLESALVGASGGSTRRSAGARGELGGLLPWPLKPLRRTTFTAILAREVRYWWREPRRRASLVSVLVVSAALPVALQFSGGGSLRFAVVVTGITAGLLVSNQFGIDGTAYAAHVLAHVPGQLELRARATAAALLLVPLQATVIVAVSVVSGQSGVIPVALGLLVSAFGASLAAGSLISVFAAYPVPESSNPFAVNMGSGSARGFLAVLGMFGAFALSVPVVVAGLLVPHAWWWLVAVGAAGYGLAAVLIGTHIAGYHLDQRRPEVLFAVTPRR
jgi:ABC-2 type transport system permease protein